jgi:AcrR family transcriptional regulator
MQILSEEKRERILSAASVLFATYPFHKVLLSDVAKNASVSKGTVYTYFKDKEHLYASVIYEDFFHMLDQLKDRIESENIEPYESIKLIIEKLIEHAYQNPHFFELSKNTHPQTIKHPEWNRKRVEFYGFIQTIIEKGIALGKFDDPYPELTARFIPGLIRSALLDGVKISKQTLYNHIIRFLDAGLIYKGK